MADDLAPTLGSPAVVEMSESGMYATDKRTGLSICMVCGAAVVGEEIHTQWHDAISSVAIESTQRIKRLEAGRPPR